MAKNGPTPDPSIGDAHRQLALMDRIIALEVENARLRTQTGGSALANDYRSTATWRIGSVMTAPARWIRRLSSRSGRD